MKIVCESCGAKYSIADEKVAGKVFKIRCKKCSAVIVVKGDQPQEGAEATRVFDYGSDAVWHVVVAGEQQGPFAPRQIGELLAEAKIDWEAYVWREGMDGWQPAKDVEPLVTAVMAEAEGAEAPKSEQSGLPSAIFGGSNDMGADPFASSDDGGLSGVIAGSSTNAGASSDAKSASAIAAGGGADLFADSTRSAFAAAADDDDDDDGLHHGGSQGARVSEDQAMTGQRNENSVLFSLSNLQALATGSGATSAAPPRGKPGMAQGEGSGLIDIRALASATQSVADRPNVSSARDKVEDLLAVGSSGTTFSATSFAAPVAADKPDSGRMVMYAMAAAVLLLGSTVLYLAVRDPAPTAQITEADEGATEQGTATGAAPTAPAPAEPAPATEEPKVAAAPAPTPSAAEPSDDKTAENDSDGEGRSRESRSERKRRSGESSLTAKSPDKEPEPAAVAEAPKKPATGDKSIDDLLDTALGSKPKPAAAAAKPAGESLAATPSRDDVLSAMKGITSAVQACGAGQSGVAMAKVGVTGSTGKVASVEVGGPFAGTPIGACVTKEVKKAKFPKFSQSTFSFSYPFKI